MDAQTTAQLAWYYPLQDSTISGAEELLSNAPCTNLETTANILHFAECHKNLSFGWDFAKNAASDINFIFPAILHGDDIYIWRMYNYLKGNPDSVVASALALTLPDNKVLKEQIHALLISKDITSKFIADRLAIPLDTIVAYEKLFFNILDRKKDHAFIAQVVYPEGRLVEASEQYISQTGTGDILLRAGFVRGADHVLYAMGLADNPFNKDDAAISADRLDRMFLADGCMYQAIGYANQRNAGPIRNARASLIAGKTGKGQDNTSMSCITPDESIKSDLVAMAKYKAQARARKLSEQFVPVVPDNP